MIFRRSITLIAVLIVFVLFGQIARRVKPINSKAGAVVRTNIKGGTVVPGVKPYTLSPFLTDIVLESTSKTTRIYDGVDLTSLSGEMDRSVRLYSPGAARISIAAKLGAPHFTPRAFLYDERNQMMAMLRQEKSEDLITWAFDIPSSGLYRLNLKFSLAAVRSIDLSTELEKTDVSYEDFVAQNVKGFEIDIAPAQLDRLNEIRLERKAMWADHVEGVKWQRRESPSERVVARIRSSGGNWAIASLGLSGRNSAHSSDLALPSLDLKIVSGSLPYGLRRFKLYVLKSKGFGRDLVHESILQDHGIVMPHGDLVQVSLNEGEPLFMELLAGMDSHLFEHAQRTEGAVLGYDVDALIATSFDNRLKSKNYFSKIKFNSDRFGTFSTESFAENVCEVPFLSVISYALTYAGNHGLGQADLRFHANSRKGCADPMVRDFNSGVNALVAESPSALFSKSLIALSPFAPQWRPNVVTHASYFVTKTADSVSNGGFYWWSVQPVTLYFLSHLQRKQAVSEFVQYWASPTMRELVQSRMSNAKRAASVLKNYGRALNRSLRLNTGPIAQDMFIEKGVALDKEYPLSIGAERIGRLIETVSKNEVVASSDDLALLNWRNETLLEIYSKTGQDPGASIPEFTKRNAITFLFWKDEPKFTNLFFIQRNLTDDPGDFVLRLESGELVKSVGELVDGSKLSTISSPSFFLNEIDGDEKVRIFHFRVARTSLHQNITPEVTGSAVYTGSRELTVNPREPVVHEASSGGNPNEVFRQIGQTFEARSNEVVIESPVEISEQQTLLVSGNQNWLFGPSGCLTIKGKLEFAPNASLRLAGVDGQRWQGVHFHNAPDTVFKNVTIEHIGTGDEFVRCGSREYTGGVSFHDMTVSLSNIEVRDSQVEDTLHFLRSKVKVDHLKIVVAQGDAVDADFSDLIVTGADISGSKGDALDVSGSYLSVSDSYLHDNADKNLSVGENSRVRILNARFERGRFGVAIKDSSNVEVDHSKFVGNEYALGQFVKKPFFIFPEVKVGADVVFIDNGQDRKEFSFQDAMKLY